MGGDELGGKPIEDADEEAHALAVVSAQKQHTLRVELPESGEQGLTNDSLAAKEGAYAFKAGSSLPEDRLESMNESQVFMVRHREELYAIRLGELRSVFPHLAEKYALQPGTIDLTKILTIQAALTRSAVPELVRSVGSTNIVRYDGYYYLVPQRLGSVRWGEEDVASLPGVVIAPSARDAFAIAEGAAYTVQPQSKPAREAIPKERNKSHSVPLLRKTVGNYNIVEYEGWYYGLPHSLGPIDLQKVDVIEIPGVIRDVSADVVEREIQELKR
jgi:hypothetical protein